MRIELHHIMVRDLTKGYVDNNENGVRAYSGNLDVRPPFQREFVYNEKQRDAVIDTLTHDFPLNVMYWSVRDDGTYEIIDGQQRTISICQYVNGDFAYMFRYFHNLQPDEQEQILNYKLQVYICSGSDSEKLKWFETINKASKAFSEMGDENLMVANLKDPVQLGVDELVIPKGAKNKENAEAFLNFILDADNMALNLQTMMDQDGQAYACPNEAAVNLMPDEYQKSPALDIPQSMKENYFLQLDIGDAAKTYDKYWTMLMSEQE